MSNLVIVGEVKQTSPNGIEIGDCRQEVYIPNHRYKVGDKIVIIGTSDYNENVPEVRVPWVHIKLG